MSAPPPRADIQSLPGTLAGFHLTAILQELHAVVPVHRPLPEPRYQAISGAPDGDTGGQRRYALPDWGRAPVIRQLAFLGRHALLIYVVHQPVIVGVLFALSLARGR